MAAIPPYSCKCFVRGCLKTAWPSVVLGLVVVLVLDLAGFDYDYEDDDEGDVAGAEFSNMLSSPAAYSIARSKAGPRW